MVLINTGGWWKAEGGQAGVLKPRSILNLYHFVCMCLRRLMLMLLVCLCRLMLMLLVCLRKLMLMLLVCLRRLMLMLLVCLRRLMLMLIACMGHYRQVFTTCAFPCSVKNLNKLSINIYMETTLHGRLDYVDASL